MKFDEAQLRLYGITPDDSLPQGRSLYGITETLLKSGLTFFQYRKKSGSDSEHYEEALALRQLCKKYRVPFVVNDRVSLGEMVDADGVHLGQGDEDPMKVRKAHPHWIIGLTAKTVEQGLRGKDQQVDYLGCGAAFPTGSKEDTRVIGPRGIKLLADKVDLPVVAIGGISPQRLPELEGTGIKGIAMISALFHSPCPEKEVERVLDFWKLQEES